MKQSIKESRKGYVMSEEARQKISAAHKGKKLSEETKRKISEGNRKARGGLNPMCGTTYYLWVHRWVRKQLGTPSKCQKCKRTDRKNYEWSNKSQKYLQDLSDWQRLCKQCHMAYDKKYKKKLARLSVEGV